MCVRNKIVFVLAFLTFNSTAYADLFSPVDMPRTGDAVPGTAVSQPYSNFVSRHIVPPTPQQLRAIRDSDAYDKLGRQALRSQNYSDAERDFRAALAEFPIWGVSMKGLAEALLGQGRNAEALQVYQDLIYPSSREGNLDAMDTDVQLHYASLLCDAGRWSQAATVYNNVASKLPESTAAILPSPTVQLDPNHPQPALLHAAVDVALGVYHSLELDLDGQTDNAKALREYRAALQITPDWFTANCYYAFGLHCAGHWAESAAAYQKAVSLATDPHERAQVQRQLDIANAAVAFIAAHPMASPQPQSQNGVRTAH